MRSVIECESIVELAQMGESAGTNIIMSHNKLTLLGCQSIICK